MDVLGGGELGRCGGAPLVKRVAVDGAAGDVGDAAEARVLVREDDLGAIGSSGFSCGEPGDAGADHQHVAMDVDLLIGVRIAAFGGFAQTSGAADDGFVDVLPEGGGPHQRLVIEAAGDEARHGVVDGAHVPVERRPAVLRDGGEAVEDLDLGGAQVRLVARTFANTGEGVHLFGAQAHHAARAMILEAAAEDALAGGHDGGGDGIALEARQRLAVEGECHALRTVDTAAAAVQSIWLAHEFFSALRRLAKYSAHGPLAWAIRSAGGSSVMP